jgi:S-adenosylmethionine:tRNA ribosyltransferase-isomerase
MLVLDPDGGALADRAVRDLPGYLAPADLLVFNDTRVVPARLVGNKPSGGRVEVLLERALEGTAALVQLSASKPIRAGLEVSTPGGTLRVLERVSDLWRVALPEPALNFFTRWGSVPLPPYIRRAADETDRERYQSIFARAPGAVAAPTASLHFDAALAQALAAAGVARTFVTLHVGAGTFQPLRGDDLAAHTMHAEWTSLGAEASAAIASTRAAGGRVIAIGTTVVRALEAAALACGGIPAPWQGETRLFITPGFQFQVVDALLTNFHLPESTLLMLVCAFAGTAEVLAAYHHAVRARYRFFSYGDAMLVSRPRA